MTRKYRSCTPQELCDALLGPAADGESEGLGGEVVFSHGTEDEQGDLEFGERSRTLDIEVAHDESDQSEIERAALDDMRRLLENRRIRDDLEEAVPGWCGKYRCLHHHGVHAGIMDSPFGGSLGHVGPFPGTDMTVVILGASEDGGDEPPLLFFCYCDADGVARAYVPVAGNLESAPEGCACGGDCGCDGDCSCQDADNGSSGAWKRIAVEVGGRFVDCRWEKAREIDRLRKKNTDEFLYGADGFPLRDQLLSMLDVR